MRFKPLRFLLIASGVLLIVWLSLPRLVGFAAEHWLAVPGLEGLRLDIAHLGGGQAEVRELRGTYRTTGGHRLQIALYDVVLDYSAVRRHIDRLQVARGEIVMVPGQTDASLPWPQLEWPQLPLTETRIGDLRITMQWPDRRPLVTQGGLRLQQGSDRQLLAEFRPASGLLRLTVTPGETVESRIEWLPVAGPAATVTLRLGRQPAQQPASLSAQAPLSSLVSLSQALGLPLPLNKVGGEVTLQAEARLGELGGSVEALTGEVSLTQIAARVGGARSLTVALDGRARVSWQATKAPMPIKGDLELLPGLNWQISAGDAQALEVSGRLEHLFALRLRDGGMASEAVLPFSVRASRWGRWQGELKQVQATMAAGRVELTQALARVRLKGLLPHWQGGGLQARVVQTEGDLGLHWQRAGGLDGDGRLQIRAERLQVTGASPLLLRNSQWAVQFAASVKSGGALASDLKLSGEASTKALKIERGSEVPVTLGPTQLHVGRLRPATQQGEFTVTASAVRAAGWPASDVSSRIVLDGKKVSASGVLQIPQASPLRFTATHDLGKGCGMGAVTLAQNLAMLGPALQPRPAALRPLDLRGGQAEGQFDLDWCTRPTLVFGARGKLRARAVDLGWEKARLEGADLSLQLDALQPVQGRLQVSARSGQLATGTTLTDLKFDAALTPKTLQMNAFDLKLLGGSVHAAPQTLPWPPDGQMLPLEVRDFDLGQLLTLFKQQGLSGSGQLSGSLPLSYREGSLEVRDGRLTSLGGGTLKYAPTLIIPDNPGLQVLRNLHFKQLGIEVWYAPGGAYRTQIKLDGSNPDFYNGYPVRFGLNLNGELPGLFRAALFSGDFNRHILEQLQAGKLQ